MDLRIWVCVKGMKTVRGRSDLGTSLGHEWRSAESEPPVEMSSRAHEGQSYGFRHLEEKFESPQVESKALVTDEITWDVEGDELDTPKELEEQ